MEQMRLILFVLFFYTMTGKAAMEQKEAYQVLCYHNVSDRIEDPSIPTVTTEALIEQFKWISQNGYNVVGIDTILAAQQGRKKLPPKALLLTFDDGYRSFYKRVYPLLKIYGFKAVLALVGRWQQSRGEFWYGEKKKDRQMLLFAKEIKEMVESGLVEVASHSFDAHRMVMANPQGNKEPFFTTLIFNKKKGSYETLAMYQKRVREDLEKSRIFFQNYLGISPRVMVWPFGAYSGYLETIAAKEGFLVSMGLDDGINYIGQKRPVKRIFVQNGASLHSLVTDLKAKKESPYPERVVLVDLDLLFSPFAKERNRRLGLLLEKLQHLKVTTVVLKAYFDRDKDGFADMLYFPNPILPMREDLLNRVLWQIKSRIGVENIYTLLPLYRFEKENHPLNRSDDLQKIETIYRYMARYGAFDGVVFEDLDFVANQFAKNKEWMDLLVQRLQYFSLRLKKSLLIDADSLEKLDTRNYRQLLSFLDYLYIQAPTKRSWLKRYMAKIVETKGAKEKGVFLFWQEEREGKRVADAMRLVLAYGFSGLGYGGEEYLLKEESGSAIDAIFSLREDPFGE